MEEQNGKTAVGAPTYSPATVLGKHGRESINGSDGNATPAKLFRCGDCDKSYSRVDHLARHVRLHTQERPYACQHCGKTFARADLLKRHAAGHKVQQDGSLSKTNLKAPNRQGRVNQACETCSELHLKCDNEKPCTRCRTKGLFCQHQSAPSETETLAHNLLSLSQSRSNIPTTLHPEPELGQDTGASLFLSERQTPLISTSPSINTNRVHFAEFDHTNFDDGFAYNAGLQMGQPDVSNMPNTFQDDGNDLRDFLQDIMAQDIAALPSSGLRSGAWTPRNLFEFGVDTNLELDDIDLDFLNDYNQHNPFVGATPDASVSAVGSLASDSRSDPPLGVESLQKSSTWRFRPQSRDNLDNALSLPATEADKRFAVDRRVTAEPLAYNARDHILAMIVSLNSETKTIHSFPSVDLLDSLMQYYLTTTNAPTNLIHAATFIPSQKRPELCAAMIAAGACLTPDAALRKLGLVIQEAVRLCGPARIEKDNTLIRDLQLLQGQLISLKVGLWSGNSRKMEMAESFMQPWTTMVRRGGWFGRRHEHIVPIPEDDGSELESKWQKWIEEESRRRLVFYMFHHDCQASISLFINPILSYSELGLPLPSAQRLWLARSAHAWKTAYLSQPASTLPLPSVLDLLQDIDRYVESHETFDMEIATQALLSATWGMVREYRQQSSVTTAAPNQWHNGTMVLSSRLTELKRLLECLRMGSPDTPPTRLFIDLLSMHLHMSLEEVHLFAGVEGHDEAKRVYPSLKEWVKTPGARQAVWHAGQIIRHAKSIPGVRDFAAVAVYQAALAIWSFGVISNAVAASVGNKDNETDKPLEPVVLIDEPEATAVHRFIALNRGRPAMALGIGMPDVANATAGAQDGGAPYALLSEPAQVMAGLMDLLKLSHKTRQSRPPLVENLLELMGGLMAAVSISGEKS